MKEPKINVGRNKGRRTLDAVEGFSTSIGEGAKLSGNIGGKGHTIILGAVEGDCDLDGTLVIGESGKWHGKLTAIRIVIAGEVEGEIWAKEKLEILSTARIKGMLKSKVLAIAEGAIHQGEVVMSNDVTRFNDKRDTSLS
ncbi:MAG: polymer-forming cytoskeletal protein [Gammaproteobacteria bacterium]|nr:polymer-forming cytoskeletal protein [Gammaproteobacteria bacterium]